MAWLGMSIPTLPGSVKKPARRHPGARNIEEDNEEQPKIPDIVPDKPEEKSTDDSKPKPQSPSQPNKKLFIRSN